VSEFLGVSDFCAEKIAAPVSLHQFLEKKGKNI
jgi:hypothetical protein